MIIDPHVHLRGEEYKGYEFLRKGFSDAKVVGIQAMLEMPNPTPNLISYDVCKKRYDEVDLYQNGVFHGINIGLTDNMDQVKEMLSLVMRSREDRRRGNEGRITADKTFYVHSTGDMGI